MFLPSLFLQSRLLTFDPSFGWSLPLQLDGVYYGNRPYICKYSYIGIVIMCNTFHYYIVHNPKGIDIKDGCSH